MDALIAAAGTTEDEMVADFKDLRRRALQAKRSLDANILVRALLGRRVRTIITTYGNTVEFFAPDVAFGADLANDS